MPLTRPLNNNCLIEVIKEHAEVSRFEDDTVSMSFGKLVDFHVELYHITASAAIRFEPSEIETKHDELKALVGKVVRWEEFAEGGQTFEEDGKTYALIPFWRLISVTEDK